VKIVFLNDLIYAYATRAPSAVGGAERQQWLLATALKEAGWRVIVGVRNGLDSDRRVVIQGVEFVGLRQAQLLWAWYRFLVSEQPDWWYWRCASHLLGLAVLIAKLARVRVIFAAGFDSDLDIRHSLFQRPHCWPLYALGLASADKIFVQNEKQLSRVPPPLRSKALKVPSMTPEMDTLIPHSCRSRYVAWVAMFRKFKRPDLLVEIAREAADVRFIVCGGPTTFTAAPGYGEQIADNLRALPNVEYLGQLSPNEAMQVMTYAALFLSTSDEEGFPNTFLQAWSAGTPVVSLKIDPDHIIKRYSLGKVSSSIQQAICDIKTLMDSPQQRETIACRARSYIANVHSAAAVIRIFESATRGVSSVPVQSHTANLV